MALLELRRLGAPAGADTQGSAGVRRAPEAEERHGDSACQLLRAGGPA